MTGTETTFITHFITQILKSLDVWRGITKTLLDKDLAGEETPSPTFLVTTGMATLMLQKVQGDGGSDTEGQRQRKLEEQAQLLQEGAILIAMLLAQDLSGGSSSH